MIDLVANDRVGTLSVLKFVNNPNNLNITDIVRVIRKTECWGLIEIHNFSGQTGVAKLLVLEKEGGFRHMRLNEDDPAINFIASLGTVVVLNELIGSELLLQMQPMEKFLCSLLQKTQIILLM